ncbi:thioredoxin domain-containing protein [Sphingobacterium siyangense]|uniref:vitamin K epoxide reductase family protein n=1 Tax=Sphingobacterium siyangense TaxID=459529 RepID=UPI00200C45BB|nr:vitamin K epoxide reductase family protein [Sphingobacterium siyangense]UQA77527.1 thioredoxin domain-containing protein [Sphingobacterium siyangense]
MKIFNLLKPKQDNDLKQVCKNLFDSYNIKYSDLHLEKVLEEHVDNSSLLSIKDTLFEYGVESAAIRKADYNYYDFEPPFICSIQQEDWYKARFTVVSQVDETNITYLDPQTNKLKEIPLSQFEKIDKGIILLMDDSNKKDESKLAAHLIEQRNQIIARNTPIYLSLITLVLSLGYTFLHYQTGISWVNIILTMTSFIGLAVSSLLLWHEIDAHNPLIREVCGGQGKKANCDDVLNSSQSSFLGISWAIWGFAFMATLFSIQVFFSGNLPFLYLSAIISLIATPYIFFSVYYQAKVIKQWCPLCLAVQGVLIINSAAVIFFIYKKGINLASISSYSIFITLLLAFFFITAAYTLIPILRNARDNRNTEKRWKKLRYNPEIFKALLDKSERITSPTDQLGIVVGNPQAKNEIIKVCNPYCGPCAKAHPELENIIKNNSDVKVRIIFTASGENGDFLSIPVQHLLAIQEKDGQETVQRALDDWYLAEVKDYEVFARKYPMNGELKQQKDKIVAMRNWCNIMKIRATPTIYINGAEMPESYKITELRNFF